MPIDKNISVYLVGLGIPESASMTLEAVKTLKKCKTIFSAGAGLYRQRFLNSFCSDVRRLNFNGKARDQDAEFRSKLLPFFQTLKTRKPIALVTFAHPMFYDTANEWILDGCRRLRLSCRVISGVSTIDAILSTLQLSLKSGSGLQAGDLEYFRLSPPNPSAHIFVFRSHTNPKSVRNFFLKCLTIYPKSHKVFFIRCENDPRLGEFIVLRSLGACIKEVPTLDFFTSIFIPRPVDVKGRARRPGGPRSYF